MEPFKEDVSQRLQKKTSFEQHKSTFTTRTDTAFVSKKYQTAVKVSVIIPVYNAENYLHQCLESVADQTLQEIEIFCINNGSTDGSSEILKEFKKRDRRIVVIDTKEKF